MLWLSDYHGQWCSVSLMRVGVIWRTGRGPGVMGKLRRAGRKAIHSWPRPRCIIVPSDLVNILNHQPKQSDPPVNTQGVALHRSLLHCCPGSQAHAVPLKPSHIHGLRLRNCLWASGSIHIWCNHFKMLEWRIKVMPRLFILVCMSIVSSWIDVEVKLKDANMLMKVSQ